MDGDAFSVLAKANKLADESPIFVDPSLRFRKIRISASLLLKRKSFLTQKLSLGKITERLIKKKQYVTSLMANDVDIAFNGRNGDNFHLATIEYQRNLTEPGMGR